MKALSILTVATIAGAAALCLYILAAGWVPILVECGRFPVGRSEATNRALGLAWSGC